VIRRSLTLVIAAAVFAACSTTGGTPSASGPVGLPTAGGCPTAQPPAMAPGETRTVTIETGNGKIVIKVEGGLSPIAAGNFVALASCGFYDGVTFHRAATLVDGTPFVIQGGARDSGPGYTIQDEPVTATYGRGTVAMARTAEPNSQDSQFFIVLSDAAGPVLASYNTYAIFGTVIEGMDVADAIYAAADAELPSHPIAMDRVSVSNP
jgi:cyclophilin family peptidyl-prolyl cis-trans isomerase